MATRAPRRSALFVAVAFLVACVGLIMFTWTELSGTIPFAPKGYEVNAVFRESGLLAPGADVRIAGVNVGRVTVVAPRGVNSLVTLEIAAPYVPVPADTRAIVRQKTLLGEAYVELSSGTRSGPKLPDGGTIPIGQVQPTTQVDQLINSFDAPTRRNLELFLSGAGASLSGTAPADLNDAIGNLDPAVTELQAITEALDAQQSDIHNLISGSAQVLQTLGQRSQDLQTLVQAGNQVLGTTAARNRQLTATVVALPPFLGQLRTSLRALGTTLALTKPSLDALLPVAPLLAPTLSNVITLSGPTLALLHQAPSLIASAVAALPALRSLSSVLLPAANVLTPAARQIAPVVAFMGLYQREIVAGMANVAAATQATAPAAGEAGPVHYMRGITAIGDESVFGQQVRLPTNRNNANFAPGELAYLGRGLRTATCANVRNPAQLDTRHGNVPCRVQPPFSWNSILRYFPHLTQAPLPPP